MNQTSLARLQLSAKINLFNLKGNPYPGRIIIVGLDETGENLVQVYAIMGRSVNSRNRIFERDVGRLFTAPADPSKVEDPSLIIYNAMREVTILSDSFTIPDGIEHIVSNGHQSDAVVEGRGEPDVTFAGIMRCWGYEPDAPNFTSRITAVSTWIDNTPFTMMSLLRKSPWSDACDRHFFGLDGFGKGFGHFISTYAGDGNPLPPFVGEPQLMPLAGDINQVAQTYWDALNVDNRVSLAVKFIPKSGPSETVIINKYEKIAAEA